MALHPSYFKQGADVAVGGAVPAEDDLPLFKVGDVSRNPDIEQREDVDSGRNFLHDDRLAVDVVGDGGVVQDDDAFGGVEVTTNLLIRRGLLSLNEIIV